MQKPILQRFSLAAASFLIASGISVQIPTAISNSILTVGAEAQARSSGGRGGGGSFGGGGGSFGGSSRPSGGGGYSRPTYRNDRPYNSGPRVYPAPVYVGPGYYSTGGGGLFWLLLLGVGFFLVPILLNSFRTGLSTAGAGSVGSYGGELENETVTISKVQVALLTHSSTVQPELTHIVSEADTSTREGLYAMLQESILSLLRKPENWSHVLVSSETVRGRQAAQSRFSQLSVTERSRMSEETLVNVGGRKTRRELRLNPDEGPGTYIVVTLLVGTAHDRPLFENSVHSAAELQGILTKLAGVSPDYLMVLELLWSPQDASDTMTEDEFVEEYSNMIKI